MSEIGNLLLFTISAWGETRWDAFRTAVDALVESHTGGTRIHAKGAEGLARDRWRALMALDSLGHIEQAWDEARGRILVGPSVLALLPAPGLPRAVLCGARSPNTVHDLHRVARETNVEVSVDSQKNINHYAPSRITVVGESFESLEEFSRSVGILYSGTPAAWALARLSGSLDSYLDRLSFSTAGEVNWPKWDFDPEKLAFREPAEQRDEFRLTKYRSPITSLSVYHLWRDGSSAQIDPTWGRYAVLQITGKHVVDYNAASGECAVPSGAPLPRILSRALALCSGWAPRRKVAGDSFEAYDYYASVPRDVLKTALHALGQEEVQMTTGSTAWKIQ